MCDYQGYEFGAHYPDSVCIEGQLWDADHYDDGFLTSGPLMPCPQCNGAQYHRYFQDETEMDGYDSVDHPFCFPKQFPKFKNVPAKQRRLVKRFWMRGRKSRIKEELKLAD